MTQSSKRAYGFSAEQANEREITCKHGHVNWESMRSGKRRCKTCRLVTRVISHYDITRDQYAALQKAQDHKCAICREKKRLCVDHCHTTGRVRGLLCHGCNTAVGIIETKPIEKLREYLNGPTIQ